MGQDISCIAPRARRSSRSSSGTTKVCDPPLLHARFQRRSYPVETPAELVEKLEMAELKLHTHQVAWLEMSSATKVVLLGRICGQIIDLWERIGPIRPMNVDELVFAVSIPLSPVMGEAHIRSVLCGVRSRR